MDLTWNDRRVETDGRTRGDLDLGWGDAPVDDAVPAPNVEASPTAASAIRVRTRHPRVLIGPEVVDELLTTTDALRTEVRELREVVAELRSRLDRS